MIPRRATVNGIHPLTVADAIGYAVCLSQSGYTKSLIPFNIYPILTDESAERADWIRILDEGGEDMLYRAEDFAMLEVPNAIEDACQHLAHVA